MTTVYLFIPDWSHCGLARRLLFRSNRKERSKENIGRRTTGRRRIQEVQQAEVRRNHRREKQVSTQQEIQAFRKRKKILKSSKIIGPIFFR